MFNIYLVVLLLGVLVVLIKLHELKHLVKLFFEVTTLLHQYINKLEESMRGDEKSIERRVDKIHSDIIHILGRIREQDKQDK